MIGLGTYAFFWQHSSEAPDPIGLPEMLRRTRALDADLFQICDYEAITAFSADQVRDIKREADDLGITLELGTRGVLPEHLATYLALSEALGVTTVRSMINTAEHKPTLGEAEQLLGRALPAYEAAGVTLALETYEQVHSRDLVSLVEAVGSSNLGICLDPANSVAALENPVDVIDRCAPYVKNMHVKDFAFTRRGGWVGFTLEGAQLGTGLLDYDHLMTTITPEARGINRVIEHWLPWQDSFEETVRMENLWNSTNLAYIRSNEK
ncbi:sugar phosphate isomerase/epimerase [Glaciihabitans sp. dw_435]|uniref:sugar phosphate isomerase/epimerase family protein n=1 Tax=Glaciihabitans sp. dw_435 TaxID=2720081 RepID=UPI001BD5AE60|nr:TIM barrel protein [Glaciihabitans sp. dw_435]